MPDKDNDCRRTPQGGCRGANAGRRGSTPRRRTPATRYMSRPQRRAVAGSCQSPGLRRRRTARSEAEGGIIVATGASLWLTGANTPPSPDRSEGRHAAPCEPPAPRPATGTPFGPQTHMPPSTRRRASRRCRPSLSCGGPRRQVLSLPKGSVGSGRCPSPLPFAVALRRSLSCRGARHRGQPPIMRSPNRWLSPISPKGNPETPDCRPGLLLCRPLRGLSRAGAVPRPAASACL